MLQSIVQASIQNRAVVVVVSVLLLVGGLYATLHAELDVFPEFAPPQVIVQTEAPGLSADEVERLVTLPLELSLQGIPGIDVLRSRSIQGLSVITIIFQDRVDIYKARQLVNERVSQEVAQLSAGVRPPKLAPLVAPTGRLLVVGFTSDKLSPLQLRDYVQWTLRPRILAVRGVAQVTLYGGEVRQFQVQVNQEYLAAHDLTLSDVLNATRDATGIRGAGFQEDVNQRRVLRIEGQTRSAEELGKAVITSSDGTPVRLHDVALVQDGAEPKFGDAAVDGQPAVTLVISKQYGGDTLRITQLVENELDQTRPEFDRQGIAYHAGLFRQADFIQHAVGNVSKSLLIGAVLVTVVLFVFLANVRVALISLTAIPLSLLSAILVLWAFGISLNTITLGGLAIAVGEVVDDAIIDVENIFRRLRENARQGNPRSAAAVVLSASLEVRSAVVHATFIVALVFMPVFFMTSLQGRMFAPLGYAYVLAILASLVTALTVTPALSLVLLQTSHAVDEPKVMTWLQSVYERSVRRLDHELPLIVTLGLLLLAASTWALLNFGGEFLPELRENHFVLHAQSIPGTSLPQSMATGKILARELKQNSNVLSVCQQAGRELGEDTFGVEFSEIEVNLKPLAGNEFEEVETFVKGTLRDNFAGCSFQVFSFLSERIMETISGSVAPVVVKVYGDDLAAIDRASHEIAQALASVPGNDNVRPEPQTGQPELVIRVRSEDAARLGLRNSDILDAVHAAYQGAEVAQAYERNRIINLVVILEPEIRNNPQRVADLWLNATEGRLQLKQVADVFLSNGRFLVRHEGGRRQQLVTCNVEGRDVQSFVTDAQRHLQQLHLPAGVNFVFTGEHEAKQSAQRELLWLGVATGCGVVLLLWMAFGSIRRLLLVLVNLPFALVGGVAAIYMSGGILDVGSLVGFVTLFGITMRNSIMMVSHWVHLHEVDTVPWGPELVFRGARERLGPILMTALVTGLGLLPIAIGSGEAGREIEGPMAMVILGGLITSTALNLFVLPVLYHRFGGLSQE